MLLNAIYSIPVQFTADNAGALIQAAQFILYEDAVSEGRLYLLRSLTAANSISAFLLAKNLGLTEVSALSAELISRVASLSAGRRTDPLHKVGGLPGHFSHTVYTKTWTIGLSSGRLFQIF